MWGWCNIFSITNFTQLKNNFRANSYEMILHIYPDGYIIGWIRDFVFTKLQILSKITLNTFTYLDQFVKRKIWYPLGKLRVFAVYSSLQARIQKKLATFDTKLSHGLLLIFFVQNRLIWNNFIIPIKNWLLRHISYSNLAKEYELLTRIKKW